MYRPPYPSPEMYRDREKEEEEEEEEEFIRIHGYYRGTQGARCQTDGASLQPDESEGCSPVSAAEAGVVAVAQWSSGRGDPALGETFRSPSKFTRGLNPTPSFSPKAETLALPWWSRSQGTRSHATPRRVRCYPVSARYSWVAVLCLPMVPAVTPSYRGGYCRDRQ